MDKGSVGTEMGNMVRASDKDAQYDEKAKCLLGHKYILAYILVNTIDEFKGMNPRDVVQYIEGEPFVGMVPVEPGMTNSVKESPAEKGMRIAGFNSENVEINEGLVRFDIVFYVRIPSADGTKNGLSQMIINVESQKDEPSGYDILNRAVFYVSRLVSSQKERDFVNTNYNDIRRVFSIWLLMNMNENSMGHVHLAYDKLMGDYQCKGRLDLLNIVLIGLSDELPGQDDKYELHRLLGALLSKQLSVDEKLAIIEKEYDIPVEADIRREVATMCNLSQGIREDAENETNAKIIMNMHRKGYTLEQIADVAEKSIEEIKAVIEKREAILV
ncbi:MAG: Rpn family recombination-promoting nuclease/putative transposase [Muribaculaceae bacterium]|nr:Rpn family recombination-promoting nuclease/putative transposase [Roseburia sp.]MCM1431743.1 Rpn family recombination-promoting nuclease/putative transposase [Muribaculaceae bacterium]MCM1493391.1 Rpn family recombination-promoting nuclease/putative transposase [Muribaculaceae bacterium]